MKTRFKLFSLIIGFCLLGSFVKAQVNCTSTVSPPCDFKVQQNFTNSDSKQIYNAIRSMSSGTSTTTGTVVVSNTVPVNVVNTVTVAPHTVSVVNVVTVSPITGTVSITGTPTVAISTNTSNVEVVTLVASSNGSIPANSFQISFLTSSDFVGTINGSVIGGNYSITMPVINYRTYPVVPYTVTGGSILINYEH